jgi:virginiamycin B lyase
VGITAGPDGALWFTECAVQQTGNCTANGTIGRITSAGAITEFRIKTKNSDPAGITAGPDGNLWFTDSGTDQIGRLTPAGVVTQFAIPTAGSFPEGITAGPDGNLWFTEEGANQIGRITPAGVIREFRGFVAARWASGQPVS